MKLAQYEVVNADDWLGLTKENNIEALILVAPTEMLKTIKILKHISMGDTGGFYFLSIEDNVPVKVWGTKEEFNKYK